MKKVGIVMGSDSDLPILRKAMDMLDTLGSSATPCYPSQPEGKSGLPRANPRGRLRSPS